jgi:uncharacterized membrane protein YeiB
MAHRLPTAIAFTLGFPLIALGIRTYFAADWMVTYSMFTGSQFNYWGSIFVAGAYVAAVMLAVRTSIMPYLQEAVAAPLSVRAAGMAREVSDVSAGSADEIGDR